MSTQSKYLKIKIVTYVLVLAVAWLIVTAQAKPRGLPKLICVLRHAASVSSVAFSPDGNVLAAAFGDTEKKGGLRLWQIPSGKLLSEPIKGFTVNQVAFTTNTTGATFVTLSEGAQETELKLWNAEAKTAVRSFPNPKHITVTCFAVDSAHNRLALGTGNFEANQPSKMTIGSLSSSRNKAVTEFKYAAALRAVAFSPDGQWLVGGGNDWDAGVSELKILDAKANRVVASLVDAKEGTISKVLFTPNGKMLAVVGDFIGMRDTRGRLKFRLPLEGHGSTAAFSPDGKYMAAGYRNNSGQGILKVWRMSSKELLLKSNLNSGIINDLSFSPDGARLASACENGTVQVWNFRTLLP